MKDPALFVVEQTGISTGRQGNAGQAKRHEAQPGVGTGAGVAERRSGVGRGTSRGRSWEFSPMDRARGRQELEKGCRAAVRVGQKRYGGTGRSRNTGGSGTRKTGSPGRKPLESRVSMRQAQRQTGTG